MKEKIICVFMLTLILTSALGMAFVIKPSFAEGGENSISSKDFMEKKDEATLSDEVTKPYTEQEKTSQSSSQTSRNSEDKWNFNDTSEWAKFAYLDGNRTRLIVGAVDDNPASLAELEKIAAKHHAEIVSNVSIGGQVRAVVVELSLASATAFVEDIRTLDLASYVEPNMKVQAQLVPNDPYWSLQWGPQKIEADYAWNTTVGDPSVLVAVVDTGIDYTHPDLAANYVPLGYDWVNMDPDPLDDFGHGTHCAGIIAAVSNNNLGIAGLAQVRVMAEKVLDGGGGGYWDWVANGIINATDCGADIISLSLGGYGESDLLHEAVKYAYDAGVLVIAAAANDNTNIKAYPAGYDEVIAVAATDQSDGKAYFSNWGDWIELAAPGVSVYSTMPTYHVTLNDWGYSMNYDYLSGTSMACPHVSGVAALVWSLYPDKTRDWVRLWLRYTADDLGDPGFDVYYGYGRVNARKAVEQTPPAHELIAWEWETPPYVEPEAIGIINATILNFGENDETDITVQLLANGTMIDHTSISFLAGGHSTTVNLLWNPTVEGLYNLTLYVVPVPEETSLENNVLWKYIYVGFPVKAVVLHSAGNVYGDIITNWQALTNEWYLFGDTMVYIDYTTLNKEGITYEDIVATEADVLIISCASDPYAGWQFTDSEIEAITQYVREGHGLIATAGTLYGMVPNNNKLAPLFGLNETTVWGGTGTDLLHLLNTTHPIFANVSDPLVFPQVGTALPYDGRWDSNELAGGKYVALGHYQESAIVTYRGLVYISPWLEVILPYYHHHLQLLYNAITWSSYQKPEHELVVSLECPPRLEPGEYTLLNATFSNQGLNNETAVELYLSIDGFVVNSTLVSELPTGASYTITYWWTPTVEAAYNVTAYTPPLPGEEFILNNVDSAIVYVRFVRLVLWDDVHDNDGDSLTGNYLELYELLSANGFVVDELTSGTINIGLLAHYDILVVIDPELDFSPSEISDIHNWIAAGGAMFVIVDTGYPPTLNTLMAPYGVQITGSASWYTGTTTNVVSHPITQGVSSIYYDLAWEIAVTPPSETLAWTVEYYGMLSAATSGEVVAISDSNIMDNWGLGIADNTRLMLNIFNCVGIKPEHDLAVTLEAPTFLGPSTSVLLNATVCNRGLSNETGVELQLIINGTIVDSVLIPELTTGASYTLSYLWTPTVEGIYDVTSCAPPVSGEELIINNVATQVVHVRYGPKLLVVDAPPPEDTGALDMLGYAYTLVTPYEFATVDLYEYNVLFIGWTPGDTLVDELVARTSDIASWVAAGNGIVALAEFDETNKWAWLPQFASGSSGYHADTVHILNPTHPVMLDLTDAELSSWGNSYHGYFLSYDPAWENLAEGVEAAQPITLATTYGAGRIVITDQDPDYHFYYGQREGAKKLLRNMIDWLTLPREEHDLAVTMKAPTTIEHVPALLNATVHNLGLSNETSVELFILINNTVVASATIAELLVAESYTLNYSWIPAIGRAYFNITAYAPPMPGENFTWNNYDTKIIYVSRDLHDLAVSLAAPWNLELGSTTTLTAVVYNFGLCNETNVELQILINGSIASSIAISKLPTDNSYTLDYLWTPTEKGKYNVTAYAPPVLGESTTWNNDETSTVNVWFGTRVFVDPPAKTIMLGQNFTITVNVANITDLAGWQINVTFNPTVLNVERIYLPAGHIFEGLDPITPEPQIDNTDGYVIWCCLIGPSAPVDHFGGSGIMCQIEFVTIGLGISPIHLDTEGVFSTILVDPEAEDIPFRPIDGVANVLPSGLIGDINGDGKVDIRDLVLLTRAFGSYPSHPRWNSEADLNGDNKVDIKDLVLLIKNFGKTR